MPKTGFELRGEFIELHTLIKLLGWAPSGGAAKAMIAEAKVSVDSLIETRKGRKLRVGNVVRVGDDEIAIVGQTDSP
jgi:ribosome-associated protein